MLYIIATRDVADWAWDDVVARFPDDEWDAALRKLASLRQRYGRCFALRDH